MSPILRNILAVIIGLVAGGALNMAIITIGGALIPPPAGVDVNDIASINAHIKEYSVVQLMTPFLAHAFGTLLAAFVATRLAVSRHLVLSMVIGALFLVGGITAVSMIPNSPMWFSVLDLVGAYIPMAWIGNMIGGRKAA